MNAMYSIFGPALVVVQLAASAANGATSLPPPGSYGFNWLDAEVSHCRKLTDTDLSSVRECTISHNAFGLELESHACKVDAHIELMVYKTLTQCQQALEPMQANGP